MSKSNFTPGPWEADGQMVVAPKMPLRKFGTELQYAQPYIVTQAKLCTSADWLTAEANAQLIAAAPELLEALEACELMMDTAALHGLPQHLPPAYRDKWAERHIAARAAIAKAKGRENAND